MVYTHVMEFCSIMSHQEEVKHLSQERLQEGLRI